MSQPALQPQLPAAPRPSRPDPPASPPGQPRVAVAWRARLLGLLPGRRFFLGLGVVLAVPALGATALALMGTAPRQRSVAEVADVPAAALPSALDERARKRLEAKLAASAPRGVHVVVDTYRNKLRVRDGAEVLREAVCSTGSGAVVRDPRNGKLWIFDTPIGERRVNEKRKNPVWNKPDWAFVEEGFVPPKKGSLRVDDFSLGDYGLYLGDGYIIHGTIFQSLLGQAITHGCIRLGDKDLEFVYHNVPTGARVYLF